MNSSTDILICGAGIAGISAAYHLTVKHGIKNVTLVDERPPLSLTSDKSTEAYRNWWPDPAMVQLMNRSIDLLEELAYESGNVFNLNRRGYVYATADEKNLAGFIANAEKCARAGAGELRIHRNSRSYTPHHAEGFEKIDGADLLLDQNLIHQHFPYLNEETIAVLHARRCGWLSAQTLGTWMLDQAKAHGAKVVTAKVIGVEMNKGEVRLAAAPNLSCGVFINAAGPLIKEVGALLNSHLPIQHELHTKVSIADALGCVPRDAPMLIWNDAQTLAWSDEERELLREDESTRALTEPLPAGAHLRPEGLGTSPIVLMLWDYHTHHADFKLPPTFAENFFEVTLRGLTTMVPSLRRYWDRPPKPYTDGGYYTKTKENRPLVGTHGVKKAFVIGAFSGYGIMCAPACGELLAAQVTQSALPSYAKEFELSRYEDTTYLMRLKSWGESGQL